MENALSQIKDALGFKKDDYLYIRPGTRKGFLDVLDLRTEDYSREKVVHLYASIQSIEIEQLYNQLSGNNLTSHFAILGIGQVEPMFTYFYLSFTKLAEIPGIINTINSLINTKIIAFYSDYEDIEKILDIYEKGDIDLWRRFYIMPLLYYLSGKPEKGIEVMAPLLKFGLVPDQNCKLFYDNYCNFLTS